MVVPLQNPPWTEGDPGRLAQALGPRELHLWCLSLDRPPQPVDTLCALLSADERERAARFHFERDSRRFACARALLRRVVGAYAGVDAAALRFRVADGGKPSIEGADGLEFNLSHSGGWVLLGVGRCGPIGVDLEVVRDVHDAEQIARHSFSHAEVDALLQLTPERRRETFFTLWTAKEAFIKALGTGLSMALDRFELDVDPIERARVRSIDGDAARAARWCLWCLRPRPDLHAAVAAPTPGLSLRCLGWSGQG